ncbi:MAG: DUF4416 family protein [Candidatus Omnitrophota bacterium]|nr:MAG: DUF4416 family protein [Candidatus Omnitrophota bacterium]
MLVLTPPLPVKFICAFIYSNEDIYAQTKRILTSRFGPIDFESKLIDFTFTDYYTEEMGKPLWRKFISFEKLRQAEGFDKIKRFCIRLEKRFAVNNRRIINIDPGYLNEAKLVLTTTKDFSHRIYLRKGVFAEVTLSYHERDFGHFPTTFPDYRTRLYKDIFLSIRDIYHNQIQRYKHK